MKTASGLVRGQSQWKQQQQSNTRRISQVHILTDHESVAGKKMNSNLNLQQNPSYFDAAAGLDVTYEDSTALGNTELECKNNRLNQYNNPSHSDSSGGGIVDDLYPNFRAFLLFGKAIGIIPWDGLLQKNVHELGFKKLSIPAIINITICLILAFNAVFSLATTGRVKIETAADYARAPAAFVFFTSGLFTFAYWYKNSGKFIGFLQKWNHMRLHYTQPDTRLSFHVNLIAGVTMTSAILENITGHLRILPITTLPGPNKSVRTSADISILEWFYVKEYGNFAPIIPYQPLLPVFLFFSNKLALYAQNFMDIAIAIFARAIYFKFKVLYKQAQEDLFGGANSNCNGRGNVYEVEKWRKLCLDHETLYKMLGIVGSLLSPIIFCSFAVNIYVVCLQLHLGLTPTGNSTPLSSIYAIWSFVHVIGRVYLVSLSAARINDWAHQVSDLFKKCPNESYIMEVERTERFVGANTIGFSGFGCFIITKPFILQIVGVVFTFEIVLLQATQTPFPAATGNGTIMGHK